MIRSTFSRISTVAAASGLALLLAACSTFIEDGLVADLVASTDTVNLEAAVGESVSGSFQVTNDESRRTRYTVTVSESAPWLSITSGSKGNLKAGRSKTISFTATCSDEGNHST